MKRNKIVIAVLLILSLLVVVSLTRCEGGPGGSSGNNTQSNTNESADTPLETMSSLSAQFEETRALMQAQVDEMKAEFERESATNQNDALFKQFEAKMEQLSQQTIGQYETEIGHLKSSLGQLQTNVNNLNNTDYPIGSDQCVIRPDGRCWFTPIGFQTAASTQTASIGSTGNILDGARNLLDNNLGQYIDPTIEPTSPNRRSRSDNPGVVPMITVPVNSTLFDAQAMTSMIGRVPIRGSVRNPMPFKVITGADNLAANNIYIDGLEHAIWSGHAVGDGALKCLRGVLNAVTFVFTNGTVYTQTATRNNQNDLNSGLGWIADQSGYGCIPGTYVSNANEVMRKLFLAGSATGAAEAFAQSQLTTSSSSIGSASALTGDAAEFALGRGLSQGFREWADYVSERAQDVFDAVVVDPGHAVVINVTQQIEIDYDTNGRRVNYPRQLSQGAQYDLD